MQSHLGKRFHRKHNDIKSEDSFHQYNASGEKSIVKVSISLYQQSDHIRRSRGFLENWGELYGYSHLTKATKTSSKVWPTFHHPNFPPNWFYSMPQFNIYEYTFILGSYPFWGNFFIIEVPSWKVFCVSLPVSYLFRESTFCKHFESYFH